jgi:hypothetical protein
MLLIEKPNVRVLLVEKIPLAVTVFEPFTSSPAKHVIDGIIF